MSTAKMQDTEKVLSLQQPPEAILKSLLQASQEEASSTVQDQKEISRLKENLEQEILSKQEMAAELSRLYEQLGQIKEKYLSLQKQAQVFEKEREELKSQLQKFQRSDDPSQMTEVEKRLQKALRENDQLAIEASEAQKAKVEAESHLKVAHHHLAKKVKVVTELNDKVDSQQQEIVGLNTLLKEANETKQTAQTELNEQSQQHRKQQDKFQEALKAAEILATEWENKCLKLYDKNQENLMTMKGLQKIEEKYYRLQGMLKNAISLFEENTDVPSGPYSRETEFPIPMKNSDPPSPATNEKKVYQNLFDIPKPR